ncbi:DUF6059 family protein [Streptomyces sp. NPDC017979]|uniref:DUF6059 family protein n=1 Tax=Streptomyces sp. NPDC017979 TaxID=3365024 RepID=UPI0037914B52
MALADLCGQSRANRRKARDERVVAQRPQGAGGLPPLAPALPGDQGSRPHRPHGVLPTRCSRPCRIAVSRAARAVREQPCGPPPGHPERLRPDLALTARERRIDQDLWPAPDGA